MDTFGSAVRHGAHRLWSIRQTLLDKVSAPSRTTRARERQAEINRSRRTIDDAIAPMAGLPLDQPAAEANPAA